MAIDLDDATASFQMHNLSIPDFNNIVNSLGAQDPPIAPIASTVSFDVQWQGKAAPTQIRDQTNGFAGLFIDSDATIAWSGSQPGFSFTSAPAATSTTISGVIGRERNGRFFHQG